MKLPWRIPTYGPVIETSLTEREATELRGLAILHGLRVLEIGAAFGYSTVLMGQVSEQIDSVDPHQAHWSLVTIRANLRKYGLEERVTLHVGASQEILPQLECGYNFAFVDGDHTAAGVAYDLAQVQRLVAGGVVAFHDWDESSCPDVRTVLEAWRSPDYVIDTLAVYEMAS